ncbi:hypothetical protein [Methylobacterium sp. J-092]|uniref:hypothetical protein n=1 Tax=Methylobacterium sp. J-092 TaxID=2836667 RepID=UPI001FBA5FD7|nr:hypothetical protein [Methylobacterium sp. J-092]MCJ2009172.1 hypothetical protein [Methylobacterium sp. J-092]
MPLPEPELFEQIGRLCSSWSLLETLSEATIWGLLKVKPNVGEAITGRMDMRGRWQLLLDTAKNIHNDTDMACLKGFDRDIKVLNQDRNVVVHGVMSAIINEEQNAYELGPAWSVQRGGNAGKRYPVSTEAVTIIRENIRTTGDKLAEFNGRFGYAIQSFPLGEVVKGWPLRL